MKLKHFKLSEFDSPDQPGSGSNMQVFTLKMLDIARERANVPFFISSGFRTKKHNKKVGGKPHSAHLRGHAADIFCNSSPDRFFIIEALLHVGFNRIGINKNFIHVDRDKSLTKNVIWTY